MKKCLEVATSSSLKCDELVPNVQHQITLRTFPKSAHVSLMHYFGCSMMSKLNSVKTVILNCVKYAVKDCLVLDSTESGIPVFFLISYIISFDDVWGLIGKLLVCTEFLPHFQAFAVETDKEWLVVRPGSELSFQALDAYTVDVDGQETLTVALRYSIPV